MNAIGDILIVDDKPENLRLLFDALSREGYSVRRLPSGQQALDVIHFSPPDLILLDILMPGMDGYEVCQRLKADSKTESIPIIFLSALDEPFDKAKAFRVGGADYVTKPFQIAEVLARIEHQLSIQRLQKSMQEHLQQLAIANQELEMFTSVAAHDLKRPLRGIHGLAQILIDEYGKQLDDEGVKYLDLIQDSVLDLDELLDSLKTYSYAREVEVVMQPVSLSAVVDRTIELLQIETQEKNAVVEVQSDLPHVMGYKPILKEVATNLLSNALKYVAPGTKPEIYIGAEVHGDRVRWFFEDNGIGIQPQHHNDIFQPFRRLHGRGAYTGSGLGLAIVQRCVTRLGGTCGIKSSQHGSQFWVDLSAGTLFHELR